MTAMHGANHHFPLSPGCGGIDIVIVNWNSGARLRECLSSVGPLTREVDHITLTVVDNASTDGSADNLPRIPCPVRIIRNASNEGFGRACNRGAQKGTAKYLLFLNPDTRLHPGALSVPFRFLESESAARVGICGVQCVDAMGTVARSCARFPTPGRMVAHSLGLDRLLPQIFPPHFLGDWPHDKDRVVDQVIGAFFFVRRELFEQLGGFDERFFVYYEDLDFSLRARRAGWNSHYLAAATIYHEGGGTSRQVRARRLFYALRSRLAFAHKHFSKIGFATVLLATLFLEPLSRTVYALAKGDRKGVADTVKAYLTLYRSRLWNPDPR
ncbi:MAG TPA: glycosyltransferase family 2 protein [Methylococcus sp.]|nr:glycosyltransferase family 2 protein [Methylococcus sp.]